MTFLCCFGIWIYRFRCIEEFLTTNTSSTPLADNGCSLYSLQVYVTKLQAGSHQLKNMIVTRIFTRALRPKSPRLQPKYITVTFTDLPRNTKPPFYYELNHFPHLSARPLERSCILYTRLSYSHQLVNSTTLDGHGFEELRVEYLDSLSSTIFSAFMRV